MTRVLAKRAVPRGLLTAVLVTGLLACVTPTRAPDGTTASVPPASAPSPGEEDYELPSSSVTTTRSYLESDPETVRAFVAALVDAIHYIKTDREGTMAIMGDFLQQDDREVLEAIYREASGNAMPEAPYPSVRAFANGLEQIASQNPTVRQVRAEDLVEDRFVRELDQSGYIRALYGR
jgi:ABC-type nitrate/sulfonate/bicarbonate transport system substrate-binding protein